MNRLEANLKVLKLLEKIMTENPHLRFGQILENFRFIEPYSSNFYQEPEDVLERVSEFLDGWDNDKRYKYE